MCPFFHMISYSSFMQYVDALGGCSDVTVLKYGYAAECGTVEFIGHNHHRVRMVFVGAGLKFFDEGEV